MLPLALPTSSEAPLKLVSTPLSGIPVLSFASTSKIFVLFSITFLQQPIQQSQDILLRRFLILRWFGHFIITAPSSCCGSLPLKHGGVNVISCSALASYRCTPSSVRSHLTNGLLLGVKLGRLCGSGCQNGMMLWLGIFLFCAACVTCEAFLVSHSLDNTELLQCFGGDG